MIKQNNDTLDQMLKERERDKEGDEEREATETERWPVSTQTHTESESALHGEERTEQLNNRKDWEKDNVSSTEFLLRQLVAWLGMTQLAEQKGKNVGVYFVW